MITSYEFINGSLQEIDDFEEASVIFCCSPDEDERLFIQRHFDLASHTMNSILDANELPRVENREDKITIICKHPLHIGIINTHVEFRVTSLGAVIANEQLLLIFNEKMSQHEFISQHRNVHNVRDLILSVLHRTMLHFHEHLRCISLAMEQIEEEVLITANSRLLVDMFTLGKSLTYYVSALNGNNKLIERIYDLAERLGFDQQQKEVLDDVRVDSAQCCQEAQITTSVMTAMTDARVSLMGNNLNILIKRLTIISLIFMPMNVIAGIGGMSEYTVMADSLGIPPWFAYILLMLLMCAAGYITYKLLRWLGLM